MHDIVSKLRKVLPAEILELLSRELSGVEQCNLEKVVDNDTIQILLGHREHESLANVCLHKNQNWSDYVSRRLAVLLQPKDDTTECKATILYRQSLFFLLALTSIQAFLQSTTTGPPLGFDSAKLVLPTKLHENPKVVAEIRKALGESLSLDGEAAYRLVPSVELFCLADIILASQSIQDDIAGVTLARLRIDFLHQRILAETSPSLQRTIYDSLSSIKGALDDSSVEAGDSRPALLLEEAAIDIHHGFDKKARENIELAAKRRGFQFALTGLPGKRTKYQEREISQLVVLAKSEEENEDEQQTHQSSPTQSQPQTMNLNDDTLLESVYFANGETSAADVKSASNLPQSLRELDFSHQPQLQPLDSIVLLSLASSITNTSPSDGLTREETLPYALRVLEGGSSNWQIYTQALLVRSRIEGYRSRTTERGLLQLQALVDQVIAETTSDTGALAGDTASKQNGQSSFLPKAKESESAPASERLSYIYQLCSPFRWELEAELASRWITLGGLSSALEIYERLEMWPEAALCLAAVDKDDKARAMMRKQLFHASNAKYAEADVEIEKWEGQPREPPPAEAPRLYCILGDLDKDAAMYEKAWEVSDQRYARAQRSLGRMAFAANDFVQAADSYAKALRVNQLNRHSWFALGCALLQLEQADKAVEAFARAVQLDDSDAEAWSNLAAALLQRGAVTDREMRSQVPEEQGATENKQSSRAKDPQQYKHDALKALRRAASLKYENSRIWDNIITVAASIIPPAYSDIISAQIRIIELRGKIEGEGCVDSEVIPHLVRDVVSTYPSPSQEDVAASSNGTGNASGQPRPSSVPQLVINLVERHITPLITTSSVLWKTVATLSLWRNKPSSSLAGQEKAWRAATSTANAGWESGTEKQWNEVVEATVELVGAYESLGPREKTEGMAAGSGEIVAKDWRFKARSAVRGILGRAKEMWEGSEGWEKLREALEDLKGSG